MAPRRGPQRAVLGRDYQAGPEHISLSTGGCKTMVFLCACPWLKPHTDGALPRQWVCASMMLAARASQQLLPSPDYPCFNSCRFSNPSSLLPQSFASPRLSPWCCAARCGAQPCHKGGLLWAVRKWSQEQCVFLAIKNMLQVVSCWAMRVSKVVFPCWCHKTSVKPPTSFRSCMGDGVYVRAHCYSL